MAPGCLLSMSHNSGTNVRKMMSNNPKVNLVNMNIILYIYIKFVEILSVCSQDIEWKRNYD